MRLSDSIWSLTSRKKNRTAFPCLWWWLPAQWSMVSTLSREPRPRIVIKCLSEESPQATVWIYRRLSGNTGPTKNWDGLCETACQAKGARLPFSSYLSYFGTSAPRMNGLIHGRPEMVVRLLCECLSAPNRERRLTVPNENRSEYVYGLRSLSMVSQYILDGEPKIGSALNAYL